MTKPLIEQQPRPTAEGGSTASVLRALHLLDLFREAGPESLGVSEIARLADMPISTAYRLLAHLVEGGFVTKDGKQYRPGGKLFELGNHTAHSSTAELREEMAPYLGDLYLATGSTVRLGMLDGLEAIIVDKIVSHRSLPAPTNVGGRVPATCTALGKAMLAWQAADHVLSALQAPLPRLTPRSVTSSRILHQQLLETRRTRIALDREESILGQVCVATPLRRQGRAVAALSASSPTTRFDRQRLEAALLKAAEAVEKAWND